MQNPTYEIEATPSNENSMAKLAQKRYVKNAPHSLPQNSRGQEVYEAIEEPVNQAEVLEPMDQFGLLPYAIHDFSEDSMSVETKGAVNRGAPTVPSKVNNRPKKGKKDLDIRRSMSESVSSRPETERKPLKPPTAQRTGVLKKPALKPVPHTHSTSVSAATPSQGAYSELDKKTSYATLEPHIGGEDINMAEQTSKESYCHLNH